MLPEAKKQKQSETSKPHKGNSKTADVGDILEIPTNELISVPQDADFSFSLSESFSDLPDISSTLKVANFVLHSCYVNDPDPHMQKNEDTVSREISASGCCHYENEDSSRC